MRKREREGKKISNSYWKKANQKLIQCNDNIQQSSFNKMKSNHITVIVLCSFYMSKLTERRHKHAIEILLIDLNHHRDDLELPIAEIFI